ncbi:MAG: DoxX family membrane protein [Thermoflexales bacterium]
MLDQLDARITRWMARYGVTLLRVGLGVVFLWFGALKFVPNLSPAQDLAARTIHTITLGLLSAELSVIVLAVWECAIGLGMITGRLLRLTILLLLLQMLGTLTPLFLFPSETWQIPPFSPTLEGQYIIKNIVLVSAALVIGATVRGGYVLAEPNDCRPSATE